MLKLLQNKFSNITLIIWMQFFLVMLFAVIAFFYAGTKSAASFFLGGIAWIIPSSFFVYQVFKKPNVRKLQTIIKDFYLGEIGKLVLSGVLLVLFLHFFALEIETFFVGYSSALFIAILVPAVIK